MLYQLRSSGERVLSLALLLYHRTRKSRSEPTSRLSKCAFLGADPVLGVGDGVFFAARVVAADGLVTKVPDFNDGWVQAGEVHDGNVKVHTRNGFDDYGAFVFFAFDDGGGAGFAFFG